MQTDMTKWTTEQIGDLKGKTVIVTGGASGIGFSASEVLASRGADLVHCREEHRERGEGSR